jgi:processive 1,2-diacylglycerol beta-glucosyltransferase
VGFTKQIPLFMDSAELVVTKAGGLSSTEAGVKNLPVVFIDAIPGLEVHNRDYFVNRGYARYGNSPEEIASHIAELLEAPDVLKNMRDKMRRDFFHRSAAEILDKVHETENQ